LEWNDAIFDARWKVPPGLTGLAQLSPVCDKHVSMENDLQYVAQRSTLLDLRIGLHSALIPLIGKQRMKNLLHKPKA
jgi:lipopolysaccharide/colanic/teichoic acid biosynthesis glycosyltransferase